MKCEDKKREKNCIEIIMKNHKNLQSYIDETIEKETSFYLIDFEFWKNWCEYVDWVEKVESKEKRNDQKNSSFIQPRINTTLIANNLGIVLSHVVYLKDYIIISEKIYLLLKHWYICLGPELKRKKIDIFDYKTLKCKSEIEIFPIFFKFFSLENIIDKMQIITKENIKQYLKNTYYTIINSKEITENLHTFSRKEKYGDILNTITKYKIYEEGKFRLWVYFPEKLTLCDYNKKLEEDDIENFAIIICECMKEGKWPSENYEINSPNKKAQKTNQKYLVGLQNIGNTCYMNSIMQIFLNNIELRDIILRPDFSDTINYKNKFGVKGEAMKEYIYILREKWTEDKKTIIPKKWKEIIGAIDESYKGNDQQDALEYFNFMFDTLHEEIDFKCDKEYIENPENYDGSLKELADEYWANNLRRNASFFHSLFLGQLKSSLACKNCSNEKVCFETFSSLPLPIPQSSKIYVEVVIFRLPFTYKIYFNRFNKYFELIDKEFDKLDKRTQLKIIKRQSLDYSVDLEKLNESIISHSFIDNQANNVLKKIPSRNLIKKSTDTIDPALNTMWVEKITKDYFNKNNDEIFMSALSTNIPMKIKLELVCKEKVLTVITKLKKMEELELENEDNYTEYIIFQNGRIIDKNLLIDDCFQNGQIIFIYELLNTKGLTSLLKYNREPAETIIKLNPESISYFHSYKKLNFSNKICTEFLVQISHRTTYLKDVYLFNNIGYEKVDGFFSLLLLNNKNPIKSKHLYDLIWEKYQYWLYNPSKFEKVLWWEIDVYEILNKELENVPSLTSNIFNARLCSPFVIKIIDKESLACSKCAWFRFCSGCLIDPIKQEYIEVMPSDIIVIEWCAEIIRKEVNMSNLKLIIDHITVKEIDNNLNDKNLEAKITIKDCFKLFTEKEELENNDIKCSKCNNKSNLFKQYKLERLPPYLTIAFKRFKFTKLYKRKINSFIEFPLNNFDLTEFICYKDLQDKSSNKNRKSIYNLLNFPSYDLFGIIYHIGSMNGGHYYSVIKNDNKWIKYDDANVYEIEENKLINENVYMIIYKFHDITYIKNSGYLKLLSDVLFGSKEENKKEKLQISEVKELKDVNNSINEINKNINDKAEIIEVNKVKNFNSPTNASISFEKMDKSMQLLPPLQYFSGEPIKTNYGRGFILSTYDVEGIPFIKVKLRKGYASIKADSKHIIRETIFLKPTEKEIREEITKKKKEDKKKTEIKNTKNSSSYCTCKCEIY